MVLRGLGSLSYVESEEVCSWSYTALDRSVESYEKLFDWCLKDRGCLRDLLAGCENMRPGVL